MGDVFYDQRLPPPVLVPTPRSNDVTDADRPQPAPDDAKRIAEIRSWYIFEPGQSHIEPQPLSVNSVRFLLSALARREAEVARLTEERERLWKAAWSAGASISAVLSDVVADKPLAATLRLIHEELRAALAGTGAGGDVGSG